MVELAFKLLIAHALADFSLQTSAMAKGKARNSKPDFIEEMKLVSLFWPYWLTAHALIHGGAVWFVTGSMTLGLAEVVLHWLIDFAKCEKWTNIHVDQLLHMICKAGYILYLTGRLPFLS